MKVIFLFGVVLVYLVFSIKYTMKICRSNLLSSRRKALHIVLTWFLPFLWIPVLRAVLFSATPGSFEVEIKNDVSGNNYYESGKGAPGAGFGFK